MSQGSLDVSHDDVAMRGGVDFIWNTRAVLHEILECLSFGLFMEAIRIIFNNATFA